MRYGIRMQIYAARDFTTQNSTWRGIYGIYAAAKSNICGSAPFCAEVTSDLAYQNASEDERRA